MAILIAGLGFGSYKEITNGIEKYKPEMFHTLHKKIIVYVIFSEILNVGLMALSYFYYNDKVIYAFKLALIFLWLITIAGIDRFCYVIPNRLILIGLITSFLFIACEIIFAGYPAFVSIKDYFFGFLFGTGIFLLSSILSRGSVGAGDIKLFSVLGLLLGWKAVFNLLFYSVLISAIFGVFVLILKKGDKKTMLPLAPFTYVGMVIILLLGI